MKSVYVLKITKAGSSQWHLISGVDAYPINQRKKGKYESTVATGHPGNFCSSNFPDSLVPEQHCKWP